MKKYLAVLFSLLSFLLVCNLQAQSDSLPESTQNKGLSFGAYLETYYIYDFNQPDNHIRPDFFYSFNRHNEFALNLGLITASYQSNRLRANLGLMAGTYSNANLAAEEGVLKNIFEAYAGVKLSKQKEIWLDAGIFSSHIGFESVIGKDCWNMTRSLLAENSPYYESGIKVSYTSDNQKWFLSGLLLNGWQRIQRVDGNQTPAFGHQITFTPSEKITLNSSSFVGNDYPESERKMRYFHDFFAKINVSEQFRVILGFDIGTEQIAKGSSEYYTWYSPILIARYQPIDKLFLSARAEYYRDENQVIVFTDTPNGFQTTGFSFNVDYLISDKVMWRTEIRTLSSQDEIFRRDDENVSTNTFLGTSLAFEF